MSVSIGNITKSIYTDTDTQICFIDTGVGADRMTVCLNNVFIQPTNNVLIINRKTGPQLLAAVDGDKRVPLYVSHYSIVGQKYDDIDVKRVGNTNIVDGLSTNDKCELCYRGEPLHDCSGIIKVSNMANAQICVL